MHHDLATVPEYFDEVTLLSRRVVASGPIETTFTREAIESTYGGAVSGAACAGR